MNRKNVIPWKIKDFSCQNMCFLYFVASNWRPQSLEPKYGLNLHRNVSTIVKRAQNVLHIIIIWEEKKDFFILRSIISKLFCNFATR